MTTKTFDFDRPREYPFSSMPGLTDQEYDKVSIAVRVELLACAASLESQQDDLPGVFARLDSMLARMMSQLARYEDGMVLESTRTLLDARIVPVLHSVPEGEWNELPHQQGKALRQQADALRAGVCVLQALNVVHRAVKAMDK